MKVLWIFSVFMGVFLGVRSESVTQKLSMQLFYGSLCPDAIRFIQNQLNPVYPEIKDYVEISFVPFGKAFSARRVDGQLSFTCQHGAADCSVSRIQMCASAYLRDDPDKMMAFVACQMASGSDRTGQTCARQTNVSFNTIESCVNNVLGEMLLIQAERNTNSIQKPLDWVPTITFNWAFNQTVSRAAERDLRTAICQQLNAVADFC